jgi:hypothetical protein
VAQNMSGLLQDWDNYYQTDSFAKSKAGVRDGCHPQIFQYGDGECNAIKAAKQSGGKILIGGFSTVGIVIDYPEVINGGVFLFSAALGLASPAGNLAERLLRTYILEPVLDGAIPIATHGSRGRCGAF